MRWRNLLLNQPLEYEIRQPLTTRNLYLVTAESCTGGLLSHLITNVPGSSAYYVGGVSTYAYEAKRGLLKVNAETLETYGAVSGETVVEMAKGVRTLFSGEIPQTQMIGISISGIAGPGGGMPGKPVGLVWFGLSTPNGSWAWKKIWNGDRIRNKELSAEYALLLIKDYLSGHLPKEDFS
jgi:PncC family amidohydrolase